MHPTVINYTGQGLSNRVVITQVKYKVTGERAIASAIWELLEKY